MSLTKRMNAQIKELSAIEGGKVDMDAPMWRAFLKTQAKVIANQMCEEYEFATGTPMMALVYALARAEFPKIKAKKKTKRGGRL